MMTFDKGVSLWFNYHMLLSNDDTTAALTVYVYSQMHVYERRLVEIRGNHGLSWHDESICLPDGTYQLAFVATHGLQFLSDIALDDIELYYEEPNHCLMYRHQYDDDGNYRLLRIQKFHIVSTDRCLGLLVVI